MIFEEDEDFGAFGETSPGDGVLSFRHFLFFNLPQDVHVDILPVEHLFCGFELRGGLCRDLPPLSPRPPWLRSLS
jgi:hypothetical protein